LSIIHLEVLAYKGWLNNHTIWTCPMEIKDI
jgi:hypothetical protein